MDSFHSTNILKIYIEAFQRPQTVDIYIFFLIAIRGKLGTNLPTRQEHKFIHLLYEC